MLNPILRLAAKIVSVVIFILTIAAAFGGRVNPEFFALPSVLVLVLPYLGVLTIIITVAWLLSGRFIIGGLGVAVIFLCGSALMTTVPVHFSKKPTEGATTFKLLTFNFIHGEDLQKPDAPGNRAINFLIGCGADIICLQELHQFHETEVHNLTKSLKDSLFAVYPYQAGDMYSDLKVLSKYPVKMVKKEGYVRDGFPKVDFFDLNVKGHRLTVANMHMNSYSLTEHERAVVTDIKSVKSAKESISEFKGTIRQKLSDSFRERVGHVRKLLSTLEGVKGPVIVCGDFNDVPESYSYRLLRDAGFNDAYVETGFGPMYTYNKHLFLFHLDQIFYKGGLQALSVKKEKIKTSDHYPLMAEFEFSE